MPEFHYHLSDIYPSLASPKFRAALNTVYGHLFGYVAPPFPLAGQGIGKQLLGRVPFQQLIGALKEGAVKEIAPLSLQREGEEPWPLPIEPIIELRGANKIMRRYAQRAEQRGSYKEYWQAEDTQITIRGLFIGEDPEQPPAKEIKRLRDFIQAGQFNLLSPLLEPLEVSRVVVKDWQLPHTPGLNNQGYVFTCYTDLLDYELLRDA